MSIPNTNDQTENAPYLRTDLVEETLHDLPEALQRSNREHYALLKGNGFAGIQNGDPDLCKEFGLRYVMSGRVSQTGEIENLIATAKSKDADCITLHVGTGLESDETADSLVEDILNQAEKTNFPVLIETHRATITQDMYRTIQLIKRFPEIRFNGDFSHWYTGQEMRYGSFGFMNEKFDFIQPVFERVRFLHGRIGNGGCMQLDVERPDMEINLHYFKEMWVRSFLGFLRSAKLGDYIIFAPELLSPQKHYALSFYQDGQLKEVGNRITQAITLKNLAQQCWEEAQKRMNN